MTANPFAVNEGPQPEAPQATQQAAPQTEAQTVTPDAENSVPKPKNPGGKGKTVADGTRKKPNRPVTPEEVEYILKNYAHKETSEIAKELGLTRMQVYGKVREARKKLLEKAEKETDPAKKQKILDWIETHLPSKKDSFGGGRKKGSVVDEVLSSLGL